ncbi:MAG: AAA family ATPase [Symploca sp. SIO2E6]|nr:AAA family ATPase [Symploca sp. SIO2E6]
MTQINHFLIGPPASGKSTLAAKLTQLDPNTVIVATDAIRTLLFGDANIQGEWSLIEKEVLFQIETALGAGRRVIYDATNAQREWRYSMLSLLADKNIPWLAWQITIPLETCLLWNQQRQRQVPVSIIEQMYRSLQEVPPQATEGFVGLIRVGITQGELDWQEIERQFALFCD